MDETAQSVTCSLSDLLEEGMKLAEQRGITQGFGNPYRADYNGKICSVCALGAIHMALYPENQTPIYDTSYVIEQIAEKCLVINRLVPYPEAESIREERVSGVIYQMNDGNLGLKKHTFPEIIKWLRRHNL